MHLAWMCVLLPRPLLCSLSSLPTVSQTEIPVVPATMVQEDNPTEKLMKLKGILDVGALLQYYYNMKKGELMENI